MPDRTSSANVYQELIRLHATGRLLPRAAAQRMTRLQELADEFKIPISNAVITDQLSAVQKISPVLRDIAEAINQLAKFSMDVDPWYTDEEMEQSCVEVKKKLAEADILLSRADNDLARARTAFQKEALRSLHQAHTS